MTSLFGKSRQNVGILLTMQYPPGVAVGGGLFLLSVMIGVIFWMSREREVDFRRREEAELLQGKRRKNFLIQ